jgi:hypothetical protein
MGCCRYMYGVWSMEYMGYVVDGVDLLQHCRLPECGRKWGGEARATPGRINANAPLRSGTQPGAGIKYYYGFIYMYIYARVSHTVGVSYSTEDGLVANNILRSQICPVLIDGNCSDTSDSEGTPHQGRPDTRIVINHSRVFAGSWESTTTTSCYVSKQEIVGRT